jgi:hypothetical protein
MRMTTEPRTHPPVNIHTIAEPFAFVCAANVLLVPANTQALRETHPTSDTVAIDADKQALQLY